MRPRSSARTTRHARRVICARSRPRAKGCARAPPARGRIATTLVIDAAAFGALGEADMVLLAQDGLRLAGASAARSARPGSPAAASARGMPCYVLSRRRGLDGRASRRSTPTSPSTRRKDLARHHPNLRVINRCST